MEDAIFSYDSDLRGVTDKAPLSDKVNYLHQVIRARHPSIQRIAIALYDEKSDLLTTYLHSSLDANPLSRYQHPLSQAASLRAVREDGRPRVVNDLSIFAAGTNEHSRRIDEAGYQASYTLPMFRDGRFFGFTFFNADRKGAFSDETLHSLDLFGHLLSLMVIAELESMRTLVAAVQTARDITHHRDNETGSHLDRMSRYVRLITRTLAPKYGFDDEFIEQLFLFSPLHDIGKIAIPDNILLKPARLTEAERATMQTHTTKGREIIDTLLENFGLDGFYRIDILRNIAEYHHEEMSGGGYPNGLSGDDIPIESRIVAVADIFDALTSERPYKRAWSNEEAFDALCRMAGNQLDRECVEALLENREQVEGIQAQFAEDPLG